MKALKIFFSIYVASLSLVQGQIPVTVTGKITNHNEAEPIYISNNAELFPVRVSDDGRFSMKLSFEALPSAITFNTITPKGTIVQQIPYLWFHSDSINITVNLLEKTFVCESPMPFQKFSESIELLDDKARVAYILQHPIQPPSLFFTNARKEKTGLGDLRIILEKVPTI